MTAYSVVRVYFTNSPGSLRSKEGVFGRSQLAGLNCISYIPCSAWGLHRLAMNHKHRTLKPYKPSSQSSIPALPLTGDGLVGNNGSIFGAGVSNNQGLGVSSQSGKQSIAIGGIQQVQTLNSSEKVLMRRIKELETQNERLKKHVGQAEDAIRNYRGFLSARSTSATDEDVNNKSSEKSCQTVDTHNVIDALQAELSNTRRRLLAAEKEQERMQQKYTGAMASQRRAQLPAAGVVSFINNNEKQDSRQSNMALRDANNSTTNKNNIIGDGSANSKGDLASWKSRCAGAEEEAVKLRSDHVAEKKKSANLTSLLKQVLSAFLDFKAQFQVEREELLSDVEQNDHTAKACFKRLQDMNASIEKRSDEFESLRLSLTLRDSQLSAAEQALGQAKIDSQHWRDKYAQLDASIQAKTDAAATTAQQVASVLAAAAERSEKVEKEKENSLDKTRVRELEERMHLLSSEREKYFSRFSGAQGQLKTVKKQLVALQEAHEDEVKAVKHSAHVKDLGRISFARELTLERDKAINDLGHAKEVENVLAFCVNTLEQSLLEVQPQVVSKVAERRAKRLRQLTKIARATSKDIDQRSTDVLAVSGAALEGFKTKAEKKVKAAVEVRERVAALLSDQVQMKVEGEQ